MSDQSLIQRVDELVEANRDAIVEALQTILRFKTVSGGGTAEAEATYLSETQKCLEWLSEEAAKHGLVWRNHDNELAVAELPGGENFVGFPVHVDVVPVGDGWKHDPFAAVIEDGVIYGRGTQDDKGPVVQALFAIALLKQLGAPLKRGARLIVGTKEECGDWADIYSYESREGKFPEFSIVGDAEFPLINGEKGMNNIVVSFPLPDSGDAEAGEWRIVSAKSGQRANIVPELATLVLEGDGSADYSHIQGEIDRFSKRHPNAKVTLSLDGTTLTLSFFGKSAHGSAPQKGHNAALDLLRFVSESAVATDDEAELAEALVEAGTDFNGGVLGIDVCHDFVGATTVNLGVLDWSDGTVRATLNIRNTIGLTGEETVAKVTEWVTGIAEETGFDEASATRSGKSVEPIFVDPDKHPEFIGALEEAYTAITGRPSKRSAIGGTTYAKAFPNAVVFGPVDPTNGEEGLAHQVDERITIENHLRNVRIYLYALVRLCAA